MTPPTQLETAIEGIKLYNRMLSNAIDWFIERLGVPRPLPLRARMSLRQECRNDLAQSGAAEGESRGMIRLWLRLSYSSLLMEITLTDLMVESVIRGGFEGKKFSATFAFPAPGMFLNKAKELEWGEFIIWAQDRTANVSRSIEQKASLLRQHLSDDE